MPDGVLSLGKGIKNTWSNLRRPQRLAVISGGVIVLVLLLILTFTSTRGPAYETLWSNLDPADAGAIVSELEKQSVPYKLTDGGKTIKILSDQVHKTRLTLATMGLPSSGVVGFESMGSNGIWSTDFERKVQYVRALSGELTRTIQALSGVEEARVHIVLPEQSVFVSQRKPATAAVLVKTKLGQELAFGSVRGIVNLVSRSIEGLSPENVTVIDASGKLLSQDLSYSHSQDDLPPNSILELTSNTEKELERRLLALLSPVLGPGNVVCQVRTELDMDRVKITDTTFESEPPGVLRSTQETSETYQGTGSMPGGQAGGLDIPSYAAPGEGESQYQRTDSLINYEVNHKITETMITPGSIKRLSVAVVVNKELDEAAKDVISETVSAALGLDPARQDQISVTGVFFDTSLTQRINESFAPVPEQFPRIYVYAIAVAAALVVGTAMIIITRRRRREQAQISYPLPQEAVPETAPSISPELMARQRSRENVERLARTDPKIVATLIKSWLLEDER